MIALTMLRAMLAASVDTPLPRAAEVIACLEKARAAIKPVTCARPPTATARRARTRACSG
jgi:hypothetical protein